MTTTPAQRIPGWTMAELPDMKTRRIATRVVPRTWPTQREAARALADILSPWPAGHPIRARHAVMWWDGRACLKEKP